MDEILKELFGDKSLSYAEFKKATKDLKLADLSKGDYVLKGKHEGELAEANKTAAGFKKQIETLTAELEKHGKSAQTIDELKKSLTEATEKSKLDLAAKDKELANYKKITAVKSHLAKAGAKDADIVFSALGLDLDKLEVKEDGSMIGLAERVENLQKEKVFLFDVKQPVSTHVPGKNTPPADGMIIPPQLLKDLGLKPN